MDKPIPEAVAILEALQERWCVSTLGKDGARRIATFDTARGIRGEDDFDNEVFATRRCASDLAVAIERIRSLTAAQQQGQAVACGGCGNADPEKVCIGCLHPFAPPQPMQQGGGEELPVCVCCEDCGTEIEAYCPKCNTAPPSAPVGAMTKDSRVPDDYRNQASGYRAGWNDALASDLARQPAADAQGGGEVRIEAHWLENVSAAASLLEASGDVFNVREADALRKLIASAERTARPSAPAGVEALVAKWDRKAAEHNRGMQSVDAALSVLAAEVVADLRSLTQQPAAVDGAEPLPEFLERVAQEVVERDTLAGTFAPGIAQALRGRASILRRALATQHKEPTT